MISRRSYSALMLVVCGAAISASEAYSKDYSASELTAFIEKKKICQFAIGGTNLPLNQLGDVQRNDKSRWPLGPYVICVGNLTAGRGTISEKSGCGASFINVETGESQPFSKDVDLIAKKDCRSGGFEELLKLSSPISNPYQQYARFDYKPTKGLVPFANDITDYTDGLGVYGRVFLYSESNSWKDWWISERTQVEAAWKIKLDKRQVEDKKKAAVEERKKNDDEKESLFSTICYDFHFCEKFGQKDCREKTSRFREFLKQYQEKFKKIEESKLPILCKGIGVM